MHTKNTRAKIEAIRLLSLSISPSLCCLASSFPLPFRHGHLLRRLKRPPPPGDPPPPPAGTSSTMAPRRPAPPRTAGSAGPN